MTIQEKIKIALSITGPFEGKGFAQVTGDFDKQGLSVGILQWCFGQGSLQKRVLKKYITKHGSIDRLAIFPMRIDHLADASVSQALAFCRANMVMGTGGGVRDAWKAAWEKFLSRPETVALQLENCEDNAHAAENICKEYGVSSLRAFCWAFDFVVQNGSMKGVHFQPPNREKFKNRVNAGHNGSAKNTSLWLEMLPSLTDEQVSLFLTGYERALLGNQKYLGDMVSRKCSIALGKGYVHGSLVNIDKKLAAAPVQAQPEPEHVLDGTEKEILFRLADMMGVDHEPINHMIEMRDLLYKDSKPRFWAVFDVGQHSSKKRLYIFDIKESKVEAHLVAHGSGSDKDHNGKAEKFSNEPGSNCTSLGVYRCGEPRNCPQHGYEMLLDGLESTNSNARRRMIVFHPANYVNDEYVSRNGKTGRSSGCPAVDQAVARELIDKLKNGSFLSIYKK